MIPRFQVGDIVRVKDDGTDEWRQTLSAFQRFDFVIEKAELITELEYTDDLIVNVIVSDSKYLIRTCNLAPDSPNIAFWLTEKFLELVKSVEDQVISLL